MTSVTLFKQDGSQNGDVTLNDAISPLNQTKTSYLTLF